MKKITVLFLVISSFGFSQKIDSNYVINKLTSLSNNIKSELTTELNALKNEIKSNSISFRAYQSKSDSILQNSNNEILNLKKSLSRFKNNFHEIKKLNEDLKKSISSLSSKIKSSTNKVDDLDNTILQIESFTDSIGSKVNVLNKDVNLATKEIESEKKLNEENKFKIDSVNQSVSKKQQYGLIIFVIFIILILTVYTILNKKWTKETSELNKKQKEIFEKQIQDSQQLTEWLSKESKTVLSQADPDHSFAKRVADEIVRIQTNLSRMDESIKGYKQLNASVRKLTQSLNSNHYEIEDLLNKSWNAGMNIQANFVLDENLKEGESIISRIIKPQINYKGKLIQAAQVEVSQGE